MRVTDFVFKNTNQLTFLKKVTFSHSFKFQLLIELHFLFSVS